MITDTTILRDGLRPVSIRGRMAFAIRCIERECDRHGLNQAALSVMLDVLWTFVETADLGAWDRRCRDDAAFDAVARVAQRNETPPNELRGVPVHLLTMVDQAIELGMAELYGGVRGWSEETLRLAISVAQTALDHGGAVPSLEPFQQYRFRPGIPVALDAWGPAVRRGAFGPYR